VQEQTVEMKKPGPLSKDRGRENKHVVVFFTQPVFLSGTSVNVENAVFA